MNDKDVDFFIDRISALENFLLDFLPPIIAASPARAQLEVQLRALADQDTSTAEDADLHLRAELAEHVLNRLPTG